MNGNSSKKCTLSCLIFLFFVCLIQSQPPSPSPHQSELTTVPSPNPSNSQRGEHPSGSDNHNILDFSPYKTLSTRENVVGLYAFFSIDNLSINASTYLSNGPYATWNVTDLEQESYGAINPNENVYFDGDTVLFDVDDLKINTSEQNITYGYDVDVDETVLPQQRYEQYNTHKSNSSQNDVNCKFSEGGLLYSIKPIELSKSVESITTFGPVNFGLLDGYLVIDFPDTETANYIKIGEYLKSTKQNDKLAIDTLKFDTLFLSCSVEENPDPEKIKCNLIAKEQVSNRILIWDVSFQSKTVILSYKLLFFITGSNDLNFAINLKNLKFYSNKLIIGIRNNGVAIYNFFAKGDSTVDYSEINKLNNSTMCSSTSIFGIYKLTSVDHEFVMDECFSIDFFNDFALYDNALYIVSNNSGLSIIDLNKNQLNSGLFPHPFFKRVNLILYRSFLFIGIEVDNAPSKGINEFFVEFVVPINKLFEPTINKVYVSESLVIYDGIQSDGNYLTIILDSAKSRLLIISQTIPNTLNIPVFQINLDKNSVNQFSKIYPISLPQKPLNFLIQGSSSKFVLSDIFAKKFKYSCKFNREGKYTLTIDMNSYCLDYINTCHQTSIAKITVSSALMINRIIVIIVVVAIALIVSLVLLIILWKKGYFRKVSHVPVDAHTRNHKFENPHMDSHINKDAEKIEVDHQKLDETN